MRRDEAELVYALINLGYIDEVPADIRDSMRVIVEKRLSRKDLVLVANR